MPFPGSFNLSRFNAVASELKFPMTGIRARITDVDKQPLCQLIHITTAIVWMVNIFVLRCGQWFEARRTLTAG